MVPESVIITKHAWFQFVRRWTVIHGCKPTMQQLRELMANVVPEDLGRGNVYRLLSNGMQPARYFTDGTWRFVMHETEEVLFTVEVALMRKPGERTTKPAWMKAGRGRQ